MDYKKSKAPVNTVTRNIMDLCKDTDNIYESVAIIASKSRSHAITRSCRSHRCWQRRSSSRTRSTGVTPRVRISSSINHVSALFLCGNVNKPFS